MRTLVFILGFMVVGASYGQLTNPQQKLVLYNGETLTGERLVYESSLLKPSVFTLDDGQFETSSVEYFQNNHGYFANLGRLHNNRQERYAMRIQKGKINLFEEIEIEVYGGEELLANANTAENEVMLASGEAYNYYSKGDGTVKKANYHNLMFDMSDNPESVKHLKAYKKYRLLQWGLIGVGTGLIAANVVAQSATGIKFNPVMAIGLVVGGGSYFLQTPKEDSIWLAADEYNKPEPAVVSNP